MSKKSERTTRFILERVAPVFSAKGYAATSLSDITSVTGLTKGAIYGNFKNKEDLALQSFDWQYHKFTETLDQYLQKGSTPVEQLFRFTEFYKDFHDHAENLGGCPFMHFGTDASHTFPEMSAQVRTGIMKLQDQLELLIKQGKDNGSIRRNINPGVFAKRFISLIQGAILMEQLTGDREYLKDIMALINDTIQQRFLSTEPESKPA